MGSPTHGQPVKRILVVEDDRTLAELLQFALSRYGYSSTCANDGEAALSSFREHQPDLVLLDIMLGSTSGLHVLSEIRKRSSVPIIMLTALDEVQDGCSRSGWAPTTT